MTIMPATILVSTAYRDSFGMSRGSLSISMRVSTCGWHMMPSVGSSTQANEKEPGRAPQADMASGLSPAAAPCGA